MRHLRSLLRAAVSACALAACEGGGPPTEPQTASITGTVRNASTDEPLAGATVSAGSVQATTDASGRFDLADVATGPSVTVRSQRAGFVAYTATIAVAEGSNTHDIPMALQFLYETPDFAVYLPPAGSAVRGVILGLGGQDTRGFATGVFDSPNPLINESQRLTRQGFLGLANTHGLAITGSVPLTDGSASDARVLAALDAVALASDRPELAQAPLVIRGISSGAPESYGFTLRQPDRVVGFAVIIAADLSLVTSAAAQRLPGYVLLAELDAVVDNEALTSFFVANRAQGALWSFAVEPGLHTRRLRPGRGP